MAEAKQCDACEKLYAVSGVDDRKFALYKDEGKEDMEAVDLCDVCYAKLPIFKQKKGEAKHAWSQEQRDAAAQRMRDRQAAKKAPEQDEPEEEPAEESTVKLGLQSIKKKGVICDECYKPTAAYTYTMREGQDTKTMNLCKNHARNAERFQGFQTAKERDDAYMAKVRT